MAEVEAIVSRAAEEPTRQRAIQLTPYLLRNIPFWGAPGYLAGEQWRQLVKNQPIAIICRDTLSQNLLSLNWSVRPREASETMLDAEKDEMDHYTDVFEQADGDFDNHIELVLQDMLDLPFGAMSEIGRLNDDPEGPVMWVEHVDAATLAPTNDREWPVMQSIPGTAGRPIVFPKHSISRMYMTPRTEIRRKGWGMAPPEKGYLAVEMLYRGDRYYANLLLDTPEAGILDLMNMDADDAEEWLDGWRTLMTGIDGFKVPVLYGHDKPAQWIPLNRPPIDMLYDSTTLKYSAILAAAYGLRLSDIGLTEQSGENTLAGVIRGERQSRRTGRALVRSKTENYFNGMLPDHLQFIWEEVDEEAKTERARALSTFGLALGQLKRDGLISPKEARHELVATGLLDVEIDPNEVPEPEVPMGMPGQPMFDVPGGKNKKDKDKPNKPQQPGERNRGRVTSDERGKVSPVDGGRGKSAFGLVEETLVKTPPDVPGEPPFNIVVKQMAEIINPAIHSLPDLAMKAGVKDASKSGPLSPIKPAPRLRKLIKATVHEMLPGVLRTFIAVPDEYIQKTWLPQMQALDWGEPSEFDDSVVLRQSAAELRVILDALLESDQWWTVASTIEKTKILDLFVAAYEIGLEEEAINIARTLYEDQLVSAPELNVGINFNVTNRGVLDLLEESAADMITNVNEGTKYFIKRIVIGGVREGMARPAIASAIRDGERASEILGREGFMSDVVEEIKMGMIEMSKARAESIVLTEVNRATNMGHLHQDVAVGLKTKIWTHLGERGTTKKGNEHPCPICTTNEELGFVPNDFMYKTVFPEGALTPPGHPNVCHCTTLLNEDELKETVKRGEFAPFVGGKSNLLSEFRKKTETG